VGAIPPPPTPDRGKVAPPHPDHRHPTAVGVRIPPARRRAFDFALKIAPGKPQRGTRGKASVDGFSLATTVPGADAYEAARSVIAAAAPEPKGRQGPTRGADGAGVGRAGHRPGERRASRRRKRSVSASARTSASEDGARASERRDQPDDEDQDNDCDDQVRVRSTVAAMTIGRPVPPATSPVGASADVAAGVGHMVLR